MAEAKDSKQKSFEWAQERAEKAKARMREAASSSHLAKDRHVQQDFFVADILDAVPKGDAASMEHPLFALRAGDRRVRTYERDGYSVQVQPGAFGCATIHDKDLWIYCISQLVAAKNAGKPIERTVRFTMYDFLVTTNRRTDGDSYRRAAAMMARLSGTRIETNVEAAGYRERAGFGLVDSWRVVERDGDDRMVAVEVTLPRWLYSSVDAMQVLTISRDYFRLRKPLDRRIYELARKHCGKQSKWQVSLKTLHEKSGSASPLRNFRVDMKSLAKSNELPGYSVAFNPDHDTLTFTPKH